MNEAQALRLTVITELEMSQLAICIFLGALILICSGFSASAEERFALLIGNKNYRPQVGALKNPHNDIALIEKALQQVGFSVVSNKDLGRVEMHRQINAFTERLSKAGRGVVGFFYYVGHGVSNPHDRSNYLIPTDIQNMQDPALWINALPLDGILRNLERDAPDASHFVVFDACRNELRLPVRTGIKGFEPITDRRGMFIAFSTGPNNTVSDVGEDNGPYAQALASELIRPGQDHVALFQNVKERVISATGNTQWPWESNGLLRFYFAGATQPALSSPVTETTPRPTPSSTSGAPQVAVGVYPQQPATPKMVRNSIDMEFVLIPAGTFQMGSNDGDSHEKPVHTVRISRSFYLGKYEVTQAQWEAVMGNNPSAFKGDSNRPVESVSWKDVQEFIRRLNTKESGARYRLPTEAEWEYAARAGSSTSYSFGNDVGQLGQYAWYYGNARGTTHPVGQLQPNAWGLYDMHGNVWEQMQDWFDTQEYARRTATGTTVVDPSGPAAGSQRVARGGAVGYFERMARSAGRFYHAPDLRSYSLGFRLLREVP